MSSRTNAFGFDLERPLEAMRTSVALLDPPAPAPVETPPAPAFEPAPAAAPAPAAPVFERAIEAPAAPPAPVFRPVVEAPVEAPAARPARERATRRGGGRLRSVRAFVLSTLLGVVAVVVVLFLGSVPLGYRSLTVMSGSMEPTLGVGDVVMERQVSPLDLHVGDIVTFRDPNEQSTLITHRVRSLKVHDGTVDVVTKGDANNTVEKWSIPADGQLGLVVLHVPKVGYALVWASGRTGRILLIAIPGVALGVIELLRIWRPRRSEA